MSLLGPNLYLPPTPHPDLSVPIHAASSATARTSHCIADAATWFSMNQLRLNQADWTYLAGVEMAGEKVNVLDMPIMATPVHFIS